MVIADSSAKGLASAPTLWDSPKRRFLLLAALGFVPVLIETLRGSNEVYDFWEYAATLRQLMLHTTHPGNPLLAIHTASAFFSPYLLVLALLGRATGTGPVHAMAMMGVVNYWLLMWGIWRFTRVFSTGAQTPFYALLFIWLLWGPAPWKYSGFFNYRTLPDVVAYPSTFGTACAMLLAPLWPRVQTATRWPALAGAAMFGALLALIELTHPIAGDMTGAALLCLALTADAPRRAIALLIGVLAVAAALCIAWPYFDFLKLTGDQGAFDPSNQAMYGGWVLHAAPMFLGIGLLWLRNATLRGRRLIIYLLPLALLYVYGAVTGHYSQGRAISPLIIGVQIGLADAVAALEGRALARIRGRALVGLAAAVAVLVVAELGNNAGGFKGSVPGTGSAPPSYAAYKLAVDGLPSGGTIMAPINDGEEAAIPTYSARLVATHRALAFVKDEPARTATVAEFYSEAASTSFRTTVIRRYSVRYILVPAGSPGLVQQLGGLGKVIRTGVMFDTIAVAAG